MTLNDVRKLAIRKQVRVRFKLNNGVECVVNEHGVGKAPALAGPPEFNLEDAFAAAAQFELEPVGGRAQTLTRAELEAMAGGGGASQDAHDHEE